MVAAVSKLQLKLEFEPDINEQFRTLKQCVAACVYGYRGGLGAVAAACDVSPSALSRMLNENEDDPRHLPIDFLTKIIETTGDIRPLQWLAAKFIPDEDTRREMALTRIEQILPGLVADLAAIKSKRR
jgi:hypothetical protein